MTIGAPFAGDKLYLTADVLSGARPGALLLFGRASAGITKNCYQGLDPFRATSADLYRVLAHF